VAIKPPPLADSAIAYRFDLHVRQVLSRLPKSVIEKLSEEELLALYQAMVGPRHHSVDLRLSVPLVPKQLYFITLVGLERRGNPARPEPKHHWTGATIRWATLISLLIGLTASGVGYRVMTGQKITVAGDYAIHPTALPWIESETDCDRSSQQWKDSLCYDRDYDPNFQFGSATASHPNPLLDPLSFGEVGAPAVISSGVRDSKPTYE
jgi:hypothetical protein